MEAVFLKAFLSKLQQALLGALFMLVLWHTCSLEKVLEHFQTQIQSTLQKSKKNIRSEVSSLV